LQHSDVFLGLCIDICYKCYCLFVILSVSVQRNTVTKKFIVAEYGKCL